MGRPSSIPAEKKTRIVLSVIAGELTVAEAARREKISEQSIGRWKADFLEAGKTALAAGRSGPSTREEQLEAEVADLTRRWVRPRSRSGCGRSPRRAGWALRGPRGDPQRGGHVDHEVLPVDRHARADLAALAGQDPRRRPGQGAVAATGAKRCVEVARRHALAHPVWGHRKIWAMVRHDEHVVSQATILRLLRDEGLILPAHYQRERRKLAERRKAASPTTRPVRTRSGSWTSPSSRPPPAAPGGWRGAGTTGPSTSTRSTSHLPATSTTRSMRSSSRGQTRPPVVSFLVSFVCVQGGSCTALWIAVERVCMLAPAMNPAGQTSKVGVARGGTTDQSATAQA